MKTKIYTPRTLKNYIQARYKETLEYCLIDIIFSDKDGAWFGFPIGEGNTGWLRFFPYANGKVKFQRGKYIEKGDKTTWSKSKIYSSIDAAMYDEFDAYPSATKSKPKDQYRY